MVLDHWFCCCCYTEANKIISDKIIWFYYCGMLPNIWNSIYKWVSMCTLLPWDHVTRQMILDLEPVMPWAQSSSWPWPLGCVLIVSKARCSINGKGNVWAMFRLSLPVMLRSVYETILLAAPPVDVTKQERCWQSEKREEKLRTHCGQFPDFLHNSWSFM